MTRRVIGTAAAAVAAILSTTAAAVDRTPPTQPATSNATMVTAYAC